MKTLDEVIKAWSICFSDNSRSNCTGCPYADEDGEAACFNHDREDALIYLREFQGLSKMWNDKLDKEQANQPLTWEELRTMDGKPVWVENQFYKRWLIAYKVNREDIIFDGNGFYTQAFSVDYGKAWQAYRKER